MCDFKFNEVYSKVVSLIQFVYLQSFKVFHFSSLFPDTFKVQDKKCDFKKGTNEYCFYCQKKKSNNNIKKSEWWLLKINMSANQKIQNAFLSNKNTGNHPFLMN